jgi:predicted nucleic acid-binding protein
MTTYLDTNLLVRHYLDVDDGVASNLIFMEQDEVPFPITDLLCLEVRNAIQRMVYESRTGSARRTTQEAAWAAIARFEEDLEEGVLLQRAAIPFPMLQQTFNTLSDRHTSRHGFRTYDIMHVASALHLGCTRFLSFDKNAVLLAKLESLLKNSPAPQL